MKILKKRVKSGRLDLPWWLWLAQGGLVLIVGTLFAVEKFIKSGCLYLIHCRIFMVTNMRVDNFGISFF